VSETKRTLSGRPLLEWHRFWVPLGGPIHCGEDAGFLINPEDRYGKAANPNVARLTTLLPDAGLLVLCGEPGMGKSTELQVIRSKIEGESGRTIWLTFREISDFADFRRKTVESAAWQQWKCGSDRMTLVVDGVDEGLLRVPNFVNDLTALLRQENLDGLRLILACRTAEWPTEMGRLLIQLWPTRDPKPVYELCPLRRIDAEMAAKAAGCDADKFLEAVWQSRVTPLAARPVTLFFLLNEFRPDTGLPATHRELYERGTANLVREIDPVRLEVLRAIRRTETRVSDSERLGAAQRLAAMLLLSGRSAIQMTGEAFGSEHPHDLRIEDAVNSDGNRVTDAALEEAVESALFTSLGERRFGFVHQTFAECLAAQHLQHLPLQQLRQLLCKADARGEHVIPQLSELAAWVAGSHAAFREHLLRIQPEVLLRSDVTRMQGALKARLVDAVLAGAMEERIFDDQDFRRFLAGLDHPALAAQLQPIISNSAAHPIARRIAISIAGACRCGEIAQPLLTVVKDSSETNHVRDWAAGALEDIVPAEQLHLFEPLAKGEVLPDPDDTIKGSALRRLVPTHWSVREALPYLTPRKNPHFLGTYEMFLRYDLPRAIADDDLPEILRWLADKKNCIDSLNSFHRLASAAFAKALKLLHVPAITAAVADLFQVWITNHELHHLPKESEIRSVLAEDESLRHQFARLYLNHPATAPDHATRIFWSIPILYGSQSLSWLLDEVVTAPAAKRCSWARVIAVLAHNPDVTVNCWDKFLLRIKEIPELAKQFDWLRSWNLDEPLARKHKAEWLRHKRSVARMAKYTSIVPDPKIQIEASFKQFAQGNQHAWIPLWYQLILGENGAEEHILRVDVDACPNWQHLSEEQRALIPAMARGYLLSTARHQDHSNKLTVGALAASSAIWMVRDLIPVDEELRDAVIESWLGVTVGYSEMSPQRLELFQLAYDLAPDAARAELMVEAEKDAQQHRHPFAFRVAATCWNKDFSVSAINLIKSSTNPRLVVNGLTELAALDLDLVVEYVTQLMQSVQSRSSSYPIHLLGALIVGLSFAPDRVWSEATRILSNDDDLARAVLARFSYGLDLDRQGVMSTLPEHKLADLYLMLRHHYPPSSDPPHGKGGFVSGEDCARRIRGQIPAMLAARATEAACQELQRLAAAIPEEATWLRWSYRDAVTNMRRNHWRPPAPEAVRAMLERTSARLITSGDELLELIIESLDRLQRRLSRQALPRAEDLWRWDGSGNRRSNFKPKDEEAISDYVACWLAEDLGPTSGVVVNREVQPRRGARTDIIVDAISRGTQGEFDKITVVVEVKGCWHDAVQSALQTQLVDGYLKVHGWRCGIYLVGWFVCPQWRDAESKLISREPDGAAEELKQMAASFDEIKSQFRVATYLLDCRLPPARIPSS
jgi:hypothetical protein